MATDVNQYLGNPLLKKANVSVEFTKEQIQELINLLEDKYDYILIDSPAGIDEGFQTAVLPATEALVVVTPEVPSIRDADKVIGILVTQEIKKISLLVNRIRPKMVKTDDMMSVEDVKNILGIELVGVVPDSEKIIVASNRGEPIVLEAKTCLPGKAFENIARRLNGEEVSFLDLNNSGGRNSVKRILRNFINRSK